MDIESLHVAHVKIDNAVLSLKVAHFRKSIARSMQSEDAADHIQQQ
jgi:hypothetical protein